MPSRLASSKYLAFILGVSVGGGSRSLIFFHEDASLNS